MSIPVQVTFRDFPASPALEARIREKAGALEKLWDRILGVRVVVEEYAKHHHKGRLFNVRLQISVPGPDIVITRESEENHRYEDPYVAVNDAFEQAERRLEDQLRRMRGNTKLHNGANRGVVKHVSPEEDFGFILTTDDREVYFHRNALLGTPLEHLDLGDEVRFVLHEDGAVQGPHASSVRLISKGQQLRTAS